MILRIYSWLANLAVPVILADDEVNLSDLGISDFMPYETHRNGWWVLLPVFTLFFVMLHLTKRSKGKS